MTAGDPSVSVSVQADEVIKLSRILNSLTQQIRQQFQILEKRGINPPPGAMEKLENAQLEMERIAPHISEQSTELDQLRTLGAVTGVINSSLNLETALEAIMETVLELTGAERGYIVLRNKQTGDMEIRFARGMDQEGDLSTDGQSVSSSIVREVLETGEPVVTTNAQHDTRFANKQSIVGFNLRSIMCVPLMLKGEIQGVMYVDNRIKDALFDRKELQLMMAVASQAILAIENARLYEQTRAVLDEITQIKTLLDNILASIASGVVTTDSEALITTFNVSAETILGVSSMTTIGQSLPNAVPDLYSEVRDYIPNIQAQGESITIETERSTGKIENQSLNLRLSPLKDDANTIRGLALVIDDVTELKQRDKTLDAIRRYLPPAMVDNISSIQNIGLAGEKRSISVLFVEVRPFDTFPENLPASELMELINLYMTVGTEAIHRKAGVIDKYMGSDIMALFNSQLNPSETYAWDSIQAAIEIAQGYQELYKRIGENPDKPFYRIGIHTGEATLGNVGSSNRREFSAIGDTVNLAKRIQENTVRGQIVISRETYDACAQELAQLNQVEILEREPIKVKGKLHPVHIYELKLRG